LPGALTLLYNCPLFVSCSFRISNKLWQQPEQTLTATYNCYVYSRGPNVLVVTTNGGSGSDNTCSVQLPESSTLLDNGVSAVHDLLAMQTVSHSSSSVATLLSSAMQKAF
jgi:hypothetical protein